MSRNDDAKISTDSEPVMSSSSDTALEESIVNRLSDMFMKSFLNVSTIPSEAKKVQNQEPPPLLHQQFYSPSSNHSSTSNILQAPSTHYQITKQPPSPNSSNIFQEAHRSYPLTLQTPFYPTPSYQQAYTTPPPALQAPPTEYPSPSGPYQILYVEFFFYSLQYGYQQQIQYGYQQQQPGYQQQQYPPYPTHPSTSLTTTTITARSFS